MILQVFSILTAASLLSLVSCTNNKKSDNARITWNLPVFKERTDTKIGRQMPPHHEPDAVLINTGGSGHPGMPGGNFPQLPPGGPGVFGFPGGQPGIPGGNFPRLPGNPGMPGGNFPGLPGNPGMPGGNYPGLPGNPGMPGGNYPGLPGNPGMPGGNFPRLPGNPGIYGFRNPGVNRPDIYGIPGIFGMPESPSYPNTFGHGFPGNAGSPSIHGVPGITSGSGVVITPQGQVPLPGGTNGYGVQFGQSGPGFSVRTGFFGPNGEPMQPGEQGPGVFAVAGSGNVPFPGIFFPGKGPSVPNPGPPNGFRPGGFFPEAPVVPNQPGPNSGGSFPRRENNGGAGGREMYDDPADDSFPFIEPIFLEF